MKNSLSIDTKQFELKHCTDFANFYTYKGINLAMVEMKPGANIGLDEAQIIIEIVSGLVDKSIKCYGITKVNQGATADAEARSYFANCKFTVDNTYAMATVFKDLPTRIIYNFYIRMQKPRIKNKAFNSIDSALKWIQDLASSNKLK